MNELVSIIVPCYNQAQYLSETLQSVFDQTYTNWECIIVNDGSTDDTEQVASEWCKKDERFIYLFQSNKGVSAARNLGIKLSKGLYIQFLDGDDILEKDKILFQSKFLYEQESVAIVYSSNRYFFSNDKENLFALHYTGIIPSVDISKKDSNQKEILSMRNVCTICSSLYRRVIFDVIHFKDIVYEDWLFNFECSLNNFLFHFENFENSTCLIRMTSNSQLIKHNTENNKTNHFNKEVNELKQKYNFNSKLLLGRDKIFKMDSEIQSASLSKYKTFIILFIPPIFFLIKNKFYKK